MIGAAEHAMFARLVEGAGGIILTTHMNPDGDAIGSEVGLARFLRAAGRDVRLVNHDPTPANLRFLERADAGAEVYDPARHDADLHGAGAVVLLDNSAPDRLGRMEPVMRAMADRILCIDHHPTRGTPWGFNILDEGAGATAALVFELVTARGWRPDPAAAQALYAGLATDTGFFRFGSATARTHAIAAELLDLGAQPPVCYQEIYERNPPAHTRLLGHALSDLRLEAGGAVASIRITRDVVERCGAEDVDTSEMTTVLLATYGVRVALLFREMDAGRVKVSLRSKDDLDVHRLASRFGGGGHRNASGIVMAGRLQNVEEEVIRAAAELVAGDL